MKRKAKEYDDLKKKLRKQPIWVIIKIKNLTPLLEADLRKKIGNDFKIYMPRLEIKKRKLKKFLLNDYIFCYHEKFSNQKT